MTLEVIVLAGLLLCPRSERRLGEAALQWVVNIPFHIANNVNIVVIVNIVMSSSLPLPSPFKTIYNTCIRLLQHSKLLSRNNYVHFLILSIHHEGGKDDWSEILVVCADICCCSVNAQVQPSRGGGWGPGTQGYCQPWPGINISMEINICTEELPGLGDFNYFFKLGKEDIELVLRFSVLVLLLIVLQQSCSC